MTYRVRLPDGSFFVAPGPFSMLRWATDDLKQAELVAQDHGGVVVPDATTKETQ